MTDTVFYACVAFVVAFVAATVGTMIWSDNENMDYDYMVKYLDKVTEKCESANSTPKEFDMLGEIVCENGATFRTIGTKK